MSKGREEAIIQLERDLRSDIARNAQLLETETHNLQAANILLSAAHQSYEITFGRYKAGVGSILELLSTQASLSTARAQLALAQITLVQARFRLNVVSGHVFFTH